MKSNIYYHFKKACSINEETGEPNYKYYQDYIDTLSEEDILEFLEECGNPHKKETDINLRMIWELDSICTAQSEDKYFQALNHY